MGRRASTKASGVLLAFVVHAAAPAFAAEPARCHYSYTVWNVKTRSSLLRRAVDKPYSELKKEEKGPFGCTPCEEDQTRISLSNGIEVKVCSGAAGGLRGALEDALRRGQKISSLVGHRPQVSRGPADAHGNRTQLSNHSFGTAVDVNEGSNGLYEDCPEWSSRCILRKGGLYRPGLDPLSLTAESPAVVELEKMGWKWGGRIAGKQKDFMHFSPTGY